MNHMKVNRIAWSKLKLQWDGRLRAAAAFQGVSDYESWAMSLTPPEVDNAERMIMDEIRGLAPLEDPHFDSGWMTPKEFRGSVTPKEKLLEQAKELRKQIDAAVDREDYETAEVLQKTLDVIKIKYDKL